MIEAMTPGAELHYLSLDDCIATALKNNLDIEVQRYVPRVSEAQALSEKGIFDPHLYFNATYFDGDIPFSKSVEIATGGLSGIKVEQWFVAGGITGAVPAGLFYDLSVTSEHTPFSTINDFAEANGEQKFEVALSLTQPILRNFGSDVNTTGISVAAKNTEASLYELERVILETVFEVETAYWELVFAYEDLRVKSHSLRLAQNLLEENNIRLKVGVLPPLAVLQSEAGVAFREEGIIVARAATQDARDRLIKAANLFPEELVWDVQLVPTDEPHAGSPEEYAEEEQIGAALGNRPELRGLLKQQEAAELGARFARNQLLPSLDLNASIGLFGLDNDFPTTFLDPGLHTGIDPALDDLFSGDNFSWTLGFRFEFPWGNHTAKGNYTSSNLLVSQLEASIRNLRLFIIQDARNALRQVDTNWKRVLSTAQTTEFRRESLVAEKKKYDVGVSTTHDLLEFEEELAEARANEQRALVDYTIALTNLMRANATLLQVRNIKVTLER